MSQANGDIFGSDFWPTPRAIGRRMYAKISKDAKYWLAEATGETHCPLHPLPSLGHGSALLLAS